MRNTYKNEEGTAIAVVELPEMTRAVHSAFFSPLTGNYALTTNADGCLLIYDVGTKTQAKCIDNFKMTSTSKQNFSKMFQQACETLKTMPDRTEALLRQSGTHNVRIFSFVAVQTNNEGYLFISFKSDRVICRVS